MIGSVSVLVALDCAVACRASRDKDRNKVLRVLAARSHDDVQPNTTFVIIWQDLCYWRPIARCESSILVVQGLRADTVRSSRLPPQENHLLRATCQLLRFDATFTRA